MLSIPPNPQGRGGTLSVLRVLRAGGNRLGDAGAEALAATLVGGWGALVTELDLEDNVMGPRGGRAMADALARGAAPRLITLALSFNRLGAGGVG
jgi:Ran GTPase-activating protein (RanGAP) involved in mRNA processing and transport